MSWFTFLIVGLLAGWIAGKFTKGTGFGFFGNLFMGIIGSYVGGWALGALGLNVTNMLGEIISASIGAILFLFIWKKLTN